MSGDTRGASAPRGALRMNAAAEYLHVSRRTLERHILADLRVIYVGRCRLIPVAELDAWMDRNARTVR